VSAGNDVRMPEEVFELRGCFVTEVGVRQAWPFLTFCDNRSDPTQERRLYIDTTFRLNDEPLNDGDAERAVTALLSLNDLTVTAVDVSTSRTLTLTFDDGHDVLIVAGSAAVITTQDSGGSARRCADDRGSSCADRRTCRLPSSIPAAWHTAADPASERLAAERR
jgi:hypothetical protein